MTEGEGHRADTLEVCDVLPVGLCDLSEGSLSSRPSCVALGKTYDPLWSPVLTLVK